jgi:enoyl-CoA hydratase
MSYATIEVRRQGATGWIMLARPEVKNALSARSFDELRDVLTKLTADDSVATIVLSGKGGVFSSGRDFKDRDVPADFEERRSHAFAALEYCPKPTIAAVAGYAITGGLTLALACDIIIAAEDAIFQDTHAKLGIITLRASRLVEVLGPLKAKELLFTCRRVTAQEALAMGLVNKVVASARLEAEAEEIAAQISRHDPAVLKAIKHVINKVVRRDQLRLLDLEELEKRRFSELAPESRGLDRGIDDLSNKG